MLNPEQLRWDLTPLYAAVDDPALQCDLAAAQTEAEAFRAAWHGLIADPGLSPAALAEALERYAALQRLALRPYFFAQLLFSGDGGDGPAKPPCFSSWSCCACRRRTSTGCVPPRNWPPMAIISIPCGPTPPIR